VGTWGAAIAHAGRVLGELGFEDVRLGLLCEHTQLPAGRIVAFRMAARRDWAMITAITSRGDMRHVVSRQSRTRKTSTASMRHTPMGIVREFALVAGAILVYFAIRNRTAGSPDEAFANAEQLVDLERWLNIAREDVLQAAIVESDVLVMVTNWVYIWGHWPVILGVATALYLRRRDRYYLLRNALFISGGIGFAFFALFPVAPPRLLDLGLVDTVTDQSSAYRALQPPGLTNQYAAFPSLHLGWNVVVGIVLLMATTRLAVRIFAVLSPLAMGFAVIATANHFFLDVVGGIAVVALGLAVALAIERTKAAATLDCSERTTRLDVESRSPEPVPRRAPCRQPPRRPENRRRAGHRARRSGPANAPRQDRGPAPEDDRPDPDPVGPLGARPAVASPPTARRPPLHHVP
jgi:hypothetical protein